MNRVILLPGTAGGRSEAHHSFAFLAHRLGAKLTRDRMCGSFAHLLFRLSSLTFHFVFSSTVVRRCHEELLERLAKKTAVNELEVSVFALPALRRPYVTLTFPPVFPQIRWSIRQVLEGLWYLHQKNIAHLDVKVCSARDAISK